jgi:septal ring factor EnvC (AmiA/AmiB activator)
MVDAAYSRKLQLGYAVVRARWQLIIPLVAAFVLIGGGWTVWAVSATKEAAPRAPDELLESTKGLEATQQQAVDQLQIVQDQLAAQQAETKKLSKQIATLTEKLDALQQSIANIPALSVATPSSLPKAQPSKK